VITHSGRISGMDDATQPVRAVIRRRVEWAQTDAAGHHHWTSVLHWAEQAETELHEQLGIADRTFGREPRAHVTVDFTARLFFRDEVEIAIVVEAVGRTSVRYGFTVTRADEPAAHGTLVTVYVDPATGRPAAWPDDLRAALRG
jgi:acyl-CoA thioester hydrolase